MHCVFFKGNSTNFPHKSVFTGLREYHCFYEGSSVKPSVAPECVSPDKWPLVMSLSGSVALWVMYAPGFEKETVG